MTRAKVAERIGLEVCGRVRSEFIFMSSMCHNGIFHTYPEYLSDWCRLVRILHCLEDTVVQYIPAPRQALNPLVSPP